MSIEALRDLGYEVKATRYPGTYRVKGHGISSEFTEAQLAGLLDEDAHANRRFQSTHREATQALRRKGAEFKAIDGGDRVQVGRRKLKPEDVPAFAETLPNRGE